MSRITEEDIEIMNKGTTEISSIWWWEFESWDKWKCYKCWKVFDIETSLEIYNGEIKECPKCGRLFE